MNFFPIKDDFKKIGRNNQDCVHICYIAREKYKYFVERIFVDMNRLEKRLKHKV